MAVYEYYSKVVNKNDKESYTIRSDNRETVTLRCDDAVAKMYENRLEVR
jgi:hypothetical protein